MAPPDPLTMLLDAAEQHARQILVICGEDELVPVFHLWGADGRHYLVGKPFDGERTKRTTALAVRDMIREQGIVRYSFVSEGWAIVRSKEFITGPVRPSEADDRIEVVVAIATDGVDYKSRCWRIRRHEGRCIDLELDGNQCVAAGGGRFDNLFTRH